MTSRRNFILGSAALMLAGRSRAAISVNKDYTLVSPTLDTLDPKRVEVMEFFWYGCPHCFALEPDVVAWHKTMPKHVYFRRVPAVLPDHWAPMAQAYYAAESLNVLDKLHHDFFNAIHLSGMNLNSRATLLKFVQSLGVDSKKFAQALDSKEVAKRVDTARELSQFSGIRGVPSFVVEGKYLTSVTQTGTPDRLFAVINELIGLAQTGKTR